MQRSPALQSLSRDHHAALKLARTCERAASSDDTMQLRDACHRVVDEFLTQLEPHFVVEELELLPLLSATAMQALAERTRAEHAQLRALVEALQQHCAAAALSHFGKTLAVHVRFEERELFPALEELL